MTVRLYIDSPLAGSGRLELPPGPARHVQVCRLQPGDPLRLFDGSGGEWAAVVAVIGRKDVAVDLREHLRVDRELPFAVTLAVGMPANERMDALAEKATELGAAVLQPLQMQRSVLKLSGDRAERRRAHWQAIAIAASEQCGRTRPLVVAPPCTFGEWLARPAGGAAERWLLAPGAAAPGARPPAGTSVVLLSGPEGGLDAAETEAAARAGFRPIGLGPRILRADTAPLAALAWLAVGG